MKTKAKSPAAQNTSVVRELFRALPASASIHRTDNDGPIAVLLRQPQIRATSRLFYEPIDARWRLRAVTTYEEGAKNAHDAQVFADSKPTRTSVKRAYAAMEQSLERPPTSSRGMQLRLFENPRSDAGKAASHRHSGHVQSFIVSKGIAPTLREARTMVRAHHGVRFDADETGSSWRFRQQEPAAFRIGSLRTYYFPDGVAVVVGRPLEPMRRNPGRRTPSLAKRAAQVATLARSIRS